ncbi:MAG: ABC transporter ATP-binding protein [Planctomycetes bacterium]|nr:ABC transporter ATP-binding protein [Planctomycetota bacterium]
MVTLVEAVAVGFEYAGGVRALRSVDFRVGAGECVAVIGPNGSGKSTLVHLLAGLLAPTIGEVRMGGDRVESLSSRERARRAAIVPQGLPRIPTLRVRDFVLGGRYAHLGLWRTASRRDHEIVDEALASVDSQDCQDRLLVEMSGGQRQRVLIARALAQAADLVLFDEPTSSLDPEHQLHVMELIRGLVDRGRGVAVVTHDFNLASQFADRVVLLADGTVVADGPVGDVLCEGVLTEVYGGRLWFGHFPGHPERPLVVPDRG